MSGQKLDLSKPNCHVCDSRLVRDLNHDKEWCKNPECQVRHIKFNIPYLTTYLAVRE